jgi:hypothetical protein
VRNRWHYLARHFFIGLFDLGFLSESAADSFTRMIVGSCAVFLSFGLLLLRVFAAHHGALRNRELFRLTFLANQTFLIAVPMWIGGFVTVLVGHALFPDETDFRILMALPVPRRLVFGAKVLALSLFVGLFVTAAHAALLPLSILISMGVATSGRWPIQFAAYIASSVMASGFASMAVTAIHGLLMLSAPRGRLLKGSASLRSVMLCVLVMAVPILIRLPGEGPRFGGGSWWLYAMPPAWFMGLERWLADDVSRAYFGALAGIGALAVVLACTVATASYAVLYRRFDRVIVGPAHGAAATDHRTAPLHRVAVSRPVFVAIRQFTTLTLRRSTLHQGILVALSAAGAGLVISSLLGHNRQEVTEAITWAPFPLMFVGTLAVRMALIVPIEQRANWIFRMTERGDTRIDQLDAALSTVRSVGVVGPIMLVAPFAWVALGINAIAAILVALLCGWLLVEILMKDWTRIPFTCSYIPGKQFVPQSLLRGFVSFGAFTMIGWGLARSSLRGQPLSLVIDAMLLAAVPIVRRQRVDGWRQATLAFEDQSPTEVNPLRLSLD